MMEDLNLNIENFGDYVMVVTYFQKYDSSTGKFVKIDFSENEEKKHICMVEAPPEEW